MRYTTLALSALLMLTLSLGAFTIEVSRLPESAFPDTEASEDAVIPQEEPGEIRTFRLLMTFNATETNNLEVAFGNDTLIEDGELNITETDIIIGWDYGEWFIRPKGMRERYAVPATATNTTHTFSLFMRKTALGGWQLPEIQEGNNELNFNELSTTLPEWLQPDNWHQMRVTVRGGSDNTDNIKARFMQDGAVIMLR